MSTKNKRFFDNDQYFVSSTPSIKKRRCISLVPTVPRGGANYTHNFSLNRSMSSDIDLVHSKEMSLDAGDRLMESD